MVTKHINPKDINTVLLNIYRQLNKAKEYNGNFFFNMATMDDSIQSMNTALKSMWQALVAYENQKNALSHLLYSKIYDLYDEAVAAINKWNEDLVKGPELLEQYNTKYAEWLAADAEAKALYATWQAMVEAYNTWYTDTYLPSYQAYETAIATARQLRDNNLALKDTTWRAYYQSNSYTNWVETEEFYHYVFDAATSDPYGTLEARLAQLQLYPDQEVVIKSCFTYVIDTDMNVHTLKYIIRVSRDSLEDHGRFLISYEYELDYATPVVMWWERGSMIETGGYQNIPAEDQADFIDTIKYCLNSNSMPNSTYCFKAVHENAITYNNSVHALMDQYQANADAAQNQMNELQSQEDALVQQKNNMWEATANKQNEAAAKAKEAMDLQIETVEILWEYQSLAITIQQDYITALNKSVKYNQAVIKAVQEQIMQGKTPVPYPQLPEPFNLVIIGIDPTTGEPVYPDMPDVPVPEPEPYPEEYDPYHGH